MSLEFNTDKVSAFRDYLVEKDYSENVIPLCMLEALRFSLRKSRNLLRKCIWIV